MADTKTTPQFTMDDVNAMLAEMKFALDQATQRKVDLAGTNSQITRERDALRNEVTDHERRNALLLKQLLNVARFVPEGTDLTEDVDPAELPAAPPLFEPPKEI